MNANVKAISQKPVGKINNEAQQKQCQQKRGSAAAAAAVEEDAKRRRRKIVKQGKRKIKTYEMKLKFTELLPERL